MAAKLLLYTFEAYVWTTSVALVVYVLFKLVRWRQKTFNYFKEIGVPGPVPSLLWGNLAEYHTKGFVQAITDWCNKYGDIFGFYNGDLPTLVVKDLDFLSYVFIKNFQHFTDRGILLRADQEHTVLSQGIIHARGAHWRRSRGCISQAFTSNKLKQTMPALSESADVFMELLAEKADAGVEWCLLEPFEGLAMDYTGRAEFGFDCCFQRNLSHPFLNTARNVVRGIMRGPFHIFAQSTSTLSAVVAPIMWLNEKLGSFTYEAFNRETTRVVELRLRNPKARKPDLLQVILDAHEEVSRQEQADGKIANSMSLQQVGVNTTVTMVAAYETTSTALSYVSYVLAKYQDAQDKVRDEVTTAINRYGKLDYEAVTQGMKYMRNVVQETMRIYPPSFGTTTRRALEDFEYSGIKYKAGTSILAPTLHIHMDPRYWPEPEKFDPDRFLPENAASRPSIAYQPFGAGPRNCVGERLALLEIMYTMARILEKYRMTLGESQKNKMELSFHAAVTTPRHGPYIKFETI